MNKILFIILLVIHLSFAMIAQSEEIPVICELREDLNFSSPIQVIYLDIDIKNIRGKGYILEKL